MYIFPTEFETIGAHSHWGQLMKEPRTCYFIPHDAGTPDGFIPSLVTENQPGHSPMTGNNTQVPWFWGHTYEEAEATANSVNKRNGITPTDAAEIICSSMFAKLDKIIANQVNEPRQLYEIAADVRRTWAKVNYAAVPYLEALESMDVVTNPYGYDTGDSIVRYFLSNATTWRGEDARRIKKELKALL